MSTTNCWGDVFECAARDKSNAVEQKAGSTPMVSDFQEPLLDSTCAPGTPDEGAKVDAKADAEYDLLQVVEENFRKELEGSAELCIYSCLALSVCIHGLFSKRARRFLFPIGLTLMLQIVVPYLMLSHRMEFLAASAPADTSAAFRVTGFLIYFYSLRNLYEGALDAARFALLEVSKSYHLPLHYIWPALLGELANTYLGFVLALNLFSNFLAQSHPSDLIINAMSLNYLVTVDNDFVDDELRELARKDFDDLMDELKARDMLERSTARRCFLSACEGFLFLIRFLGIACGGTALAVVFLTCSEHEMTEWSDYVVSLGEQLLYKFD